MKFAHKLLIYNLAATRISLQVEHPHTEGLLQWLRQADIDRTNEQTRVTLKNVRSCKLHQLFAAHPRRFKVTLRDDAQFNSTIYLNRFWINKKTVLHVVDEATRAAR